MQRLMIYLCVFIASVVVALLLMTHPSKVLLYYPPWMIALPIWIILFAGLILLLLLYLPIYLLHRFHLSTLRIKFFIERYRAKKQQQRLISGLLTLIEGRWSQAEPLLATPLLSTHEGSLLSYLGAAKATQQLRAFDRRNQYLQKASLLAAHSPALEMTVSLVQAQFALEEQRFEQAIVMLTRLRQLAPHHPQVLLLLQQVYKQSQGWEALSPLLVPLRKANLLTLTESQSLEKLIFCRRLATEKTYPAIKGLFHALSPALSQEPAIMTDYVKQLLKFPEGRKEGEKLINKTLAYRWVPTLAQLSLHLEEKKAGQQLKNAEGWLVHHGPQAELFFILAMLCVRAKLWGKAKEYFAKSLAKQVNIETALAYGQLLEQLHDPAQALQVYRESFRALQQQASDEATAVSSVHSHDA